MGIYPQILYFGTKIFNKKEIFGQAKFHKERQLPCNDPTGKPKFHYADFATKSQTSRHVEIVSVRDFS